MPAHQHPTKRCDTCEFWARGDQWPFDETRHIDDRIAACHRNAPRPSLGDFEYEVLNMLSTVTWHVGYVGGENEKDFERQFGNWEEAYIQKVSWPSTSGSEWCGEWQPQTYEPQKASGDD